MVSPALVFMNVVKDILTPTSSILIPPQIPWPQFIPSFNRLDAFSNFEASTHIDDCTRQRLKPTDSELHLPIVTAGGYCCCCCYWCQCHRLFSFRLLLLPGWPPCTTNAMWMAASSSVSGFWLEVLQAYLVCQYLMHQCYSLAEKNGGLS